MTGPPVAGRRGIARRLNRAQYRCRPPYSIAPSRIVAASERSASLISRWWSIFWGTSGRGSASRRGSGCVVGLVELVSPATSNGCVEAAPAFLLFEGGPTPRAHVVSIKRV
jgi:hypothetical protein